MKRKVRLHIATEVDPDLWEQFREQAFAENLTTGQLLDRLIAAYLDVVQNHHHQAATSSTLRPPEDIVLEKEREPVGEQ